MNTTTIIGIVIIVVVFVMVILLGFLYRAYINLTQAVGLKPKNINNKNINNKNINYDNKFKQDLSDEINNSSANDNAIQNELDNYNKNLQKI